MHFDQVPILVPQQELERPILGRLEAGASSQLPAERAVVEGGHRREHVPGVNELRLDLCDASEHLERGVEIVPLDLANDGSELVKRKLHPELGHLMDDDEESLVVVAGDRFLRAEDLLELEIAGIAHPPFEVPMDLLSGEIDGARLQLVSHSLDGNRPSASGQVARVVPPRHTGPEMTSRPACLCCCCRRSSSGSV